MRFGTILMFAIAFACAAVAALLVRSAIVAPVAGPVVVETKPAEVPMRTVMVASRDLKPGEKLTAAAVREASWPAGMLPRGVLHRPRSCLRAAWSLRFTPGLPKTSRSLRNALCKGPIWV